MTNNWQPIETAPRDGTPILAFFTGLYETGDGIEFAVARYSDGDWIDPDDCSPYRAPDFWQPLPPPPEGSE